MHRERRRRIRRSRQIQIDREIRHRRHRHAHGVADDHRVRRNRDRRFAAEGERPARRGLNGALLIAQRDVRAADRHRRGAVRVGEDDARFRSADGGVHDLPQGLIREVDVRRRRERLTGRRRSGRCGRRRTARIDHERPKGRARRRYRILWTPDFSRRPGANPALGGSALRAGVETQIEGQDREHCGQGDARAQLVLHDPVFHRSHRRLPQAWAEWAESTCQSIPGFTARSH